MKSTGERRSVFGGTIVTCYARDEGCVNEFRSASDPDVIDAQLVAAGWQARRTRRGTIYRCPAHALRTSRKRERGAKVVKRAKITKAAKHLGELAL